MRTAIALIAVLCASAASAQTAEDGWGVTFKRDTFEGTIFPLAIMAEAGDETRPASLLIACDEGKKLRAFYQSGSFIASGVNQSVQFKAGEKSDTFLFRRSTVKRLGNRIALPSDETEGLISMFVEANNEPIAYRADSKQGLFPSIGAKTVVDTIRANCP